MSETNTEHEKEPIVTADAPSTAPPKEVSDTQPRLPLGGGSEGVQGGFPLKRDARMVCL